MLRLVESVYLLVDISKLSFAPIDNVLGEPGEGLVGLQREPDHPADIHSAINPDGPQRRFSV